MYTRQQVSLSVCFLFFKFFRALHIYPIGQNAQKEAIHDYFGKFGKITSLRLDKAHASARIEFSVSASLVKDFISTGEGILMGQRLFAKDCSPCCVFCERYIFLSSFFFIVFLAKIKNGSSSYKVRK